MSYDVPSAQATETNERWTDEATVVAEPIEGRRVRGRFVETDHLDRAIQIVLRGLAALPRSTEVLKLVEQAERLRADMKHWPRTPPSPAERERVNRATLAIHLEALRAAFSAPQRRPPTPANDPSAGTDA